MSMKEIHKLNGKDCYLENLYPGRTCVAGWKPSTAKLLSVPAWIVDACQMWNALPEDKHNVNYHFYWQMSSVRYQPSFLQ